MPTHRCQTPLFPEVAREFLRYLQDGRHPESGDPAFLHELAHYEWVEMALSLENGDLGDTAADTNGDLMAGVPVLSSLAWPLSYRYPVHRIRPEFQPGEAPDEPTHLLVYRDRSDAVHFMQLNQVSRYLLELLQGQAGIDGAGTDGESRQGHQSPGPRCSCQGRPNPAGRFQGERHSAGHPEGTRCTTPMTT